MTSYQHVASCIQTLVKLGLSSTAGFETSLLPYQGQLNEAVQISMTTLPEGS